MEKTISTTKWNQEKGSGRGEGEREEESVGGSYIWRKI